MQAAARNVPLDSLKVELNGTNDLRAGRQGFENAPFHPTGISYTVTVKSPASSKTIDELIVAVEASCPILSLLRHPQEIRLTVNHIHTSTGNI